MKTCLFWLLFAGIQAVNAILFIPGVFICLWPALARVTWIYWNSDDPPTGWPWAHAYIWLAFRNNVANLRRVWGVSGAGRPLLYDWWGGTPDDIHSGHYYKIGWESGDPFEPVISAGAGRGY
jgi:hypothetical protein